MHLQGQMPAERQELPSLSLVESPRAAGDHAALFQRSIIFEKDAFFYIIYIVYSVLLLVFCVIL